MKNPDLICFLVAALVLHNAVWCSAQEEAEVSLPASKEEWQSGKALYPPDMIDIQQITYMEKLDDVIIGFQSILFSIYNLSAFTETIKRTGEDLSWAKRILDVGTGAGPLAFLALAYGADYVIGTDIDPWAIKNARYNAKRLGLEDKFEARLVPMSDTGAFSVIGGEEKFDLIMIDPPQDFSVNRQSPAWYHSLRSAKKNFYANDPGGKLLVSLMAGLKDHLTENGRVWVSLRTPSAQELIYEEAKEYGLNIRIIFDGRQDIDYSKVQFLTPLPPKNPKFHDGVMRMTYVKVYEVTVP